MRNPSLVLLGMLALVPSAAMAQRTSEPVQRPAPTATVQTRPPAPRQVVARITGERQVTVTWTPVAGATAYHVGRYAPPNGWQRAGTLGGGDTAFVDGGRDLTTPHTYRVVAVVGDFASLPATSEPVSRETSTPVETPPADTVPTTTPTTPSPNDAYCMMNDAAEFRSCKSATYRWTGAHSGIASMTATCAPGYRVVSGGYSGHFEGAIVIESSPRYPESWEVRINGIPTPNATSGNSIWAVAYCQRKP